MSRRKLSYSALNILARCGQQYDYRYNQGLKIPPGIGAIVGRGVDNSVNANLTTKILNGKGIDLMEARDLARDGVHHEFESEGVWLTPEEAEQGMKRVKADAVDASVRLAQLHHVAAAPGIHPTHVQRKWELEVRGLDLDLTGYIDIQEGAASVRDTKTAAKSPSADEAQNSMQLTTYAMAVAAIDGAIPAAVKLDYLVKTKTPKLVQIQGTRTHADFRHVLERVHQATLAMESGVFTPAPLDAWWCSEKWCGYWTRCPYARRPVSMSVLTDIPTEELPAEEIPAAAEAAELAAAAGPTRDETTSEVTA